MRILTVILAALLCLGWVAAMQDDDQLMQQRNQRRAFYTAPPVIPHEVSEAEAGDCMDCHSMHMDMGDGTFVNQSPHEDMGQCLQCHVPTAPFFGEAQELPENSFEGLAPPEPVEPDYADAPPPVPHRIFLRSNCGTCHSPDNQIETLRVDHLDRGQCFTCHPVDEDLRF